ncbi:Na(+)/H(+) antiporter subunit B [Haliovirga abyssi]|uniref:MrpA C-terminal/MbhD domain-containing protein n=1 Tax=Haliovirga abyssi TaxID=2996794 RepID=A0AAU9DEG3_9FUSO|nr:DUF4040 domain-containing protein [Haliovirga abyssi]BDU50732.1 hypothetical protein HLVA_13010 [Haliovirga abyssi]
MGIIEISEIIIGLILILFGIMAVSSKKVLNSIIYLSIMSMLAVVSFVFMKSPDVGITEAVIGSGMATALFLFTLFSAKKEGDK